MGKTLTIEGVGKTLIKPDQMIITIRMEEYGETFGDARTQLEDEFKIIQGTFKDAGLNPTFIERSGIQTQFIDPVEINLFNEILDEMSDEDLLDFEDFSESHSLLPEYSCTELITFVDKVNPEALVTLLDTLEYLEDDNYDVAYGISSYDAHKNDALILAINDANDKAKLITTNTGTKLEGIETIEYLDYDEDLESLDQIYFEFDMGTEVVQRVSITWNIK